MKKNGNHFIAQTKLLFDVLQEIQEEHWYWFNSRHGANRTQEHDLIINYIVLHSTDGETFVFRIMENSELPVSIRNQCQLALDWLFGMD